MGKEKTLQSLLHPIVRRATPRAALGNQHGVHFQGVRVIALIDAKPI